MLNRRRMLAIGGAVGGALLLPEGVRGTTAAASGPRPHVHRQPAGSVRPHAGVPEFSVQMPVPKVLRPFKGDPDIDFYRLPIRPTSHEILPGLQTSTFTYNGDFVGPTIKARAGRPVSITYGNQLDRPANVHLHGGHVAAIHDGHPMDLIATGGTRNHYYPNTQQGATLWYHDHSHHTEAEHVYFGLHGFYLIDDPAERNLGLPSGQYDVPIMLRDAQFDETGQFVFGDPAERHTILANGKPQPYFPVAARKYRFRLLNTGLERNFVLNLGGVRMLQIASDGGLLPAPVPRTEFRLSTAERTEIVIDFSRFPVGTKLVLADATEGPVLRFDVVRTATDDSRVPSTLRPLPALPPATTVRNIALNFDFSGGGEIPVGVINGQAFDPNRVDVKMRRGSTEIWNVTNADQIEFNVPHNFHLHLVQFRVLSRDGNPPDLDDMGRKDTVLLPPGKTVRVQATFGDHLGRYVYHCHFLEHSSLGMMAQMEVLP